MASFNNGTDCSIRISRRSFLASCSACAVASDGLAQAATAITLDRLNCFEIRVANVDASVAFYQGLFGMPVQARDGQRTCLRIGDGPQFMAIRQVRGSETPAIAHLGYSVGAFDVERVLGALQSKGFEHIDAPPVSAGGIEHAMKTWVRMRGTAAELYFADARGLVVQLSDPAYCGGTGPVGDGCGRPPVTAPGTLELDDLNHFTVFVNDGAKANRFYQDLFGLAVQAYQGPQAPVTGIGDGYQFVMYAGPPRDETTPANIHHACFSIRDFDVGSILAALTDSGLSARGDAAAGPMMHYVTLRMPDRGGAEGGTPEVYFTDPDGILLQLQDPSYCGGGGYLGNECLAA